MDNLIKTKNKLIQAKGSYSDYDKESMKNVIFYAEDKKKIIVDGIEYGLDLESDEVDLISNIDHKDNKLTITFSNGKTKELELEDHRAYWEELPSLEESFPKGGCIINTHPIKEFSFIGSGSGNWYSSDGQEGLYTASDKTITFEEEGEYTLKFVNNYEDGGYNGLRNVTDNSVKSVLMIGGSNGRTDGVGPVNKNENAKLILNNNITSIGSNAFDTCIGFTGELKLPDSLTSIGDGAFFYCSGFTSLKLPDSLTSIRDHTFQYCSGFTGELKLPENLTSIGYGAFMNCLGFTGDLIIPESVTSIETSAFRNCSGFTGELKIPESVTSIETSAFRNCTGLSKIYVCEDTKLAEHWNADTPAEVIKYKKGETPWLTDEK